MSAPGDDGPGRGAAQDFDAGLAAERTSLAWTRTALSLAVAGALLVRLGIETPLPALGWALGGADVLIAAAIWYREDRRHQLRRQAPAGQALPPQTGLFWLISIATIVTAAAGVALAFLH